MGKLVRDRIPERLRARGEDITVVALTGAELGAALREKVLEEAREVVDAGDRAALTEEIADLREVLVALAAHAGIPEDELRVRGEAKRSTHGGFEAGLYSTGYRAP